jgi:hypothetical protein
MIELKSHFNSSPLQGLQEISRIMRRPVPSRRPNNTGPSADISHNTGSIPTASEEAPTYAPATPDDSDFDVYVVRL